MKKLVLVPVVAVVAAVGAASAAGFAGGFSANSIQTGQTGDLECAQSAKVIEWGANDSAATPFVDSALVRLSDAECQGQAVHLVALNPNGTEKFRFNSARLSEGLASGTQNIRLYAPNYPNSGIPTADLTAVRVTVDGGYAGMPVGGSN